MSKEDIEKRIAELIASMAQKRAILKDIECELSDETNELREIQIELEIMRRSGDSVGQLH